MNFDFSTSENPTDINGTFLLDFNGTFASGSPADELLNYVDYSIEKLPQDVIKQVIDMDMVGVMRVETIQSMLDVAWEQNLTYNLMDYKLWKEGSNNCTCDDVQDWMPNMDYDLNCNDHSHYPINYVVKIANKPPRIVLTDDYLHMTGLDIHFHAYRPDTNKTLMNFIMGNMTVAVNQFMNEDLSLHSDIDI